MPEREPIDEFTTWDGNPRCQGRSRQHDRQCLRAARPGTSYCKNHGGNASKGPAHPNYKHGRHSRYTAPPKLADDYERALDDTTLTEHRAVIALQDALIQQALNEYEDAGGEQSWRALKTGWRRLKATLRTGDRTRIAGAVAELDAIVEAGPARAAKRKEISRMLERSSKMADAETRRKLAEAQIYPKYKVVALASAFGEVAVRYLAEAQRVAFFNEYAAIVREGLPAHEPRALEAPDGD